MKVREVSLKKVDHLQKRPILRVVAQKTGHLPHFAPAARPSSPDLQSALPARTSSSPQQPAQQPAPAARPAARPSSPPQQLVPGLAPAEVFPQGGGHQGLENLVFFQELPHEGRRFQIDIDVFRGVQVLAGYF